jgi:hypothetical protein
MGDDVFKCTFNVEKYETFIITNAGVNGVTSNVNDVINSDINSTTSSNSSSVTTSSVDISNLKTQNNKLNSNLLNLELFIIPEYDLNMNNYYSQQEELSDEYIESSFEGKEEVAVEFKIDESSGFDIDGSGVRSNSGSSDGSSVNNYETSTITESDIAQDFINIIKPFRFKNMKEIDEGINSLTKGQYTTFKQFFNSTQANKGAFAKDYLNAASIISDKNLVMFNYIQSLTNNSSLNVLEALVLWVTSLSESLGDCSVVEYGNLNYFFGTNGGVKMSYNRSPNLTVKQCLQNPHFKKRFNTSSYKNINLFKNIESWCGGTDKIPDKYTIKDNSNIIYNCDFCKFRGRGYIQYTWRDAYKNLLTELIKSAPQSAKDMISYWKRLAGSEDLDALLNVSSSDEWDTLFKHPEVGNIAYRVTLQKHSYTHNVDKGKVIVNLDNSLSNIKTKLIEIGKVPSWSATKYGIIVYNRVAQICNTLMDLNK